jgi:hypothetical protein
MFYALSLASIFDLQPPVATTSWNCSLPEVSAGDCAPLLQQLCCRVSCDEIALGLRWNGHGM